MPAPATSSRHLYTEHRRGHIQAAPRLRAHRGEPLSRDHPQIPVSMPSLFRFDASAVVHTCSSSHRTPAPLTARRHPQRSPPRLLTDAACGGLESPPPRQPRRTYLHHWHSTDRADDLLHRHHFPSGHTWVPETPIVADQAHGTGSQRAHRLGCADGLGHRRHPLDRLAALVDAGDAVTSDASTDDIRLRYQRVPETLPWSLTCRDGGRC